jgi:C-terminal processing protease CtpA/Prc
LRGIDWDALAGRYRKEAQSAETPAAFATAISGMLAELEDIHVWIELPDGRQVYPYSSGYRANFDHRAVEAMLDSVTHFGGVGFTGRTKEGFGVLVVGGLPSEGDDVYRRLIDATTRMFGAPGFIVDLRSNGGGSETRAQQIAGLFADKRYLYARSKVRSGPQIDDFGESRPRYIGPAVSEPYARPVVCLVGPGCVSSGEGFALMMKAMNHVTLVGQHTRGASGNPAPVTLPNGVAVWFSRWVAMEPDGAPFEGRGIAPDVEVEPTGPGDPTFETAIKILRGKTG